MSEDLNAVEAEVVEAEVAVEEVIPAEEAAVEAAAEEEIAAVVPEKKAASRGKKIQDEPEAAADAPAELEEVVVPAPVVVPAAVTPVTARGGMSISIRNRK
jgi:hypothetical protein